MESWGTPAVTGYFCKDSILVKTSHPERPEAFYYWEKK